MSSDVAEDGQRRRVKEPTDREEERALKNGLIEDDNEDIAYLNFSLLWPIGILSALSVGFFALALITQESIEHITEMRPALNQFWLAYGKAFALCTDHFKYKDEYFPSILRQIEIKVLTNVFFRVAVCVPMAARIFVAILVRNNQRSENENSVNQLFKIVNEAAVYVAAIEILSQGMFAIVTIRLDFNYIYRHSFTIFAITSSMYMLMRTILLFPNANQESEPIDTIATLLKAICAIVYCWTISQFYPTHMNFIVAPPCHGYVPKGQAILEYIMVAAYLIFHLSSLVDIRFIRFICYPRTCSGECEPLKPENFSKNGKYEFCRSYELRQRQVMGIED
uniref:Transmembrane protein n=1 Tax=Panagrellus redivivus TaxID=6233 RepID=A0A7E4VVQ8_PANRE